MGKTTTIFIFVVKLLKVAPVHKKEGVQKPEERKMKSSMQYIKQGIDIKTKIEIKGLKHTHLYIYTGTHRNND